MLPENFTLMKAELPTQGVNFELLKEKYIMSYYKCMMEFLFRNE